MPRTPSILAIATATLFTSMPSAALAQETDESASAGGIGEIVVTARKRAEDVLKTPVAISAFSGEDLSKQSLASVTDLAVSTPSMNLNSNNSGRNDRSFQQVIIRGFVPSNAQNPTTSTFIDGV
ncbi:MAG: TonB-dependent receptor plug domain-containing protein, partial [Sphingorhabdus sp.]|nr:TonB-dependent receptor plug domain-containing protein [Sphingorhabdus sp.]